LYDIQDEVEEVKNRGKEELSHLYDLVKDGIIKEREE
jgi:hypothetical protein